MALSDLPAYYVIRTSTVLPTGGADTSIDISPIEDISAMWVVSGPADAEVKFGNTGATAVPTLSTDPVRSRLSIKELYGSSSGGGTLVLELHGR